MKTLILGVSESFYLYQVYYTSYPGPKGEKPEALFYATRRYI